MKTKAKLKHKRKVKSLHFSLYLLAALLIFIFGSFFLKNILPNSACANSISCITDLTGKPETNTGTAVFMGKQIEVPKIAFESSNQHVLGTTTIRDNKHIYINLTTQMLYAVSNGVQVYAFPVSSGKWAKTPTGDFTTWIKLQATRMTGGNPAIGTYYDLPNVPYTMFFANSQYSRSMGYSIHGAYWHNNFGHPMSHGCINLSVPNAKIIYDWANPTSSGFATYVDSKNPGTPITIYGTAPLN